VWRRDSPERPAYASVGYSGCMKRASWLRGIVIVQSSPWLLYARLVWPLELNKQVSRSQELGAKTLALRRTDLRPTPASRHSKTSCGGSTDSSMRQEYFDTT